MNAKAGQKEGLNIQIVYAYITHSVNSSLIMYLFIIVINRFRKVLDLNKTNYLNFRFEYLKTFSKAFIYFSV